MGGEPVSVETQVVAGTNYFFKFADGTTVKIFEQVWTNTFRVEEPCRPAGSAVMQAASTVVETPAVAETAPAETSSKKKDSKKKSSKKKTSSKKKKEKGCC